MHELNAILGAWAGEEADSRLPPAVLATVVHVQGSAYRRPGARMLILPDGRRIGSISGGCLEGDVSQKAWWLTGSGGVAVRVYDTSSGSDAVWEFGLSCNGVVQLLLERVDTAATREMLGFLSASLSAGRHAGVATVVRAAGDSFAPGRRLLVDESGIRGGSLVGTALAGPLWGQARTAIAERRSRYVHLDGCEAFVEWVGPPQRLIVFGAGHDAQPLVRIAHELGMDVTVADGRPAYATAQRFPEARKVAVMRPADPLSEIDIPADAAVVMMTHNYPQDARLLPRLLAAQPRYLGMLGPRSRTERLFEDIGWDPGRIPEFVDAPVGLDIGADTPEAIALSIASGIQAALAGRAGGALREKRGPIHAAPLETGAAALPRTVAENGVVCETLVAG